MPTYLANGLIEVVPGLMIWTLIAFAITFFVLRKYAFGPIQKTIDERRDRIRNAVAEADAARDEARALLEEHRKLIAQAKGEAGEILAEARRVGDAQLAACEGGDRGRPPAAPRGDPQADRGRDDPRAGADPRRGRRPDARGHEPVVGRVLTAEDHRRLIDEAVGDLDFSALEGEKA